MLKEGQPLDQALATVLEEAKNDKTQKDTQIDESTNPSESLQTENSEAKIEEFIRSLANQAAEATLASLPYIAIEQHYRIEALFKFCLQEGKSKEQALTTFLNEIKNLKESGENIQNSKAEKETSQSTDTPISEELNNLISKLAALAARTTLASLLQMLRDWGAPLTLGVRACKHCVGCYN